MIQKIKQKFSPGGSALIVTMIILGIILVSTLSISLVAVQERKASIGESKSNQAYQNAEMGVEKVMQATKKGGISSVSDIAGSANVDCEDGILVGDNFKVELKDADDTKILCNSTDAISSVKSVKSVGTAGGNQRAVGVAVAAESVDFDNQKAIYVAAYTGGSFAGPYGTLVGTYSTAIIPSSYSREDAQQLAFDICCSDYSFNRDGSVRCDSSSTCAYKFVCIGKDGKHGWSDNYDAEAAAPVGALSWKTLYNGTNSNFCGW